MGTGKSAVGRVLSQKLGWSLFDTDEIIEKQVKCSIAEIIRRQGEPSFREVEKQTVRMLALLDKSVIASGGGIPLYQENMVELERHGLIVCLAASPETILGRIKDPASRPLLDPKDPIQSIKKILSDRARFYSRCALKLDTDHLAVVEVADKIISELPVVSHGA